MIQNQELQLPKKGQKNKSCILLRSVLESQVDFSLRIFLNPVLPSL